LENLLFLVPILGCLAIALGRATATRQANYTGTPTGELALTLRERIRWAR